MTTDEMARAYRAGGTLQQIARAAGRSVSFVRVRILRAGVKMRRAGRPSAARYLGPRWDAWQAAYEAGASLDTIARADGVSGEAVRRALIARGIRRRPVGPVPHKMRRSGAHGLAHLTGCVSPCNCAAGAKVPAAALCGQATR